jgi:hypothetical protein
VLDPLLKIIAKEYIDHASLTSSLSALFHLLLCDKRFTFRMHMTKTDFDSITEQGALAKDNDALWAPYFDMGMRKQVNDYIKKSCNDQSARTKHLKTSLSLPRSRRL